MKIILIYFLGKDISLNKYTNRDFYFFIVMQRSIKEFRRLSSDIFCQFYCKRDFKTSL